MLWLEKADKLAFEYIQVYFVNNSIVSVSEIIVKESYYLLPALVFFAFYAWKNPGRAWILFFLTILVLLYSEGLASILKESIGRLRPSIQWMLRYSLSIYSFPSAHALNTMAIFYFLSVWFRKKWLIPFSLVIGIARMLAGYHYPLDILGGWILGYGVAVLIIYLFAHLMPDSGKVSSLP